MPFGRDDDPLNRVLAPPPNESSADRERRLMAEAEAKRISDAIDEELQQQQKAEKRGSKPIKILLLGQSESGKSTTLKNFQLLHSQRAFRAERASWRAVILLNVVRSIRLILEAIAEVHALQSSPVTSSPILGSHSLPGSRHSSAPSTPTDGNVPKLTPEHLKLRLRLLPLLQVEEVLIRKLIPAGSPSFEASHLAHITNMPTDTLKEKEVAVNSYFAWKNMFNKMLGQRSSMDSLSIDWDDPDDPGRIIHACAEDMIQLWSDPIIHNVLEHQKLRLHDMPGFFLDSLDRITALRYVPSDDDVLRARLKTLGVSEYRFQVKDDRAIGFGSTPAWAPFFDDMNAILFLAPISCFDQVLEEDQTVNRLEDSVLLWKSIISNPLLAKTNIVLFLNKIDILKAKLRAGIRFGDYIVSYGSRPNDFDSTSSYLKRKFQQIHRENSPEPRPFYCHFTTVTDPKATSLILADVQDTIVRKQLQESKLVG